jgi:excisionase family DNA binding protein
MAVLGVSTRTVYNLARKGEIPAMRVGREWRFARQNFVAWVTNGSQADQLAAALRNGRMGRRRGWQGSFRMRGDKDSNQAGMRQRKK